MGVSVKPRLLFLAHLLPWPLEGGGQIKSYQTLCLLASHFEVTVLAFVRSDSERQNALPLQSLCKGGLQMVLLPRSRWRDMAAVGSRSSHRRFPADQPRRQPYDARRGSCRAGFG
jgi:hypothetical protein